MSHGNTQAALDAFDRGYQPIPIRDRDKIPSRAGWNNLRWSERDGTERSFDTFREEGASNIGLLLGKPSGGLIDIDIDSAKAERFRHILPETPMRSGRPNRPNSHLWYVVPDLEPPATRQFKLPDGSMCLEFRSTGAQTVIPPSVHPDGTVYRWDGEPWGGDAGPLKISGRELMITATQLHLLAVLLDGWPKRGSRHEAYLALAGGILRYGDEVHPFWDDNLPPLIKHLAIGTDDEEGPEARTKEVMGTTRNRLREGGKAVGFPRLAELLESPAHAEMARRLVQDLERLAWGKADRVPPRATATTPSGDKVTIIVGTEERIESSLQAEDYNPMTSRVTSWADVDLEPYLSGKIKDEPPTILQRNDRQGLMYPGKVNSIYGKSESAKSWIALFAAQQEIAKGGRVIYLDFEDEPTTTLSRLTLLGSGHDDIRYALRYVHPEGPLADMERYAYGAKSTPEGDLNKSVFDALLKSFDPTMIIADGMTSLYGLHGHNTNDATSTDVITTWLKGLCLRENSTARRTVIVIDHTGKASEGTSPIGAHHKIAMVQGTALRVEVITRPVPGQIGRVRLAVQKDRPGLVRKASVSLGDTDYAAIVVINSETEGVTSIELEPFDPTVVTVKGGAKGIGDKLAGMSSTPEQDREAERARKRAELDQRAYDYIWGQPDHRIIQPVRTLIAALTEPGKDAPSTKQAELCIARLVAHGRCVTGGSTRDRWVEALPVGGSAE